MRKPIALMILLTLGSGAAALFEAGYGAARPVADGATQPVLVELYQSQGCSSCPPADANVNAIVDRSDVVALSFGVTYWDYLGWRDSFANRQFTQRQWDYARFNRQPNVATPQIWINGRTTIIGNDAGELNAAIRAADTIGPALSAKDGAVTVGTGRAPVRGADVWVANFDPRTIQVSIRAGENNGRTLPHRNIVKQLTKVGHWSGRATSFPLPRAPAGLSTAVFVQAGSGGPVLAAARF